MVSRTSVLGGEARGRGLFGGARRSRSQVVSMVVAAIVTAILVLTLKLLGAGIAAVLIVVVWAAFADDGTGNTLFARRQARSRMKWRRRKGFDRFVPVQTRPEGLRPDLGRTRRERRASRLDYNSYRDWPDGVDGLYWLEQRPGRPAIAFHAPTGEANYVSATFSVDGPIQGLHGDAFIAEAQWRFGQLMAGWGAAQKLVTGIQITTRMLPSDSAFHEQWLESELDPEAPLELQEDYDLLLATAARASFVQRHYVTIRWDADARFMSIARRRGPGLTGVADLIREQIVQAERRLADGLFQKVHPLSGPQLGAVLRHLQHPDWSIDRASDVNVDSCWLPSQDEWSHTQITAQTPDPYQPDRLLPASDWLHRTAEIPVTAIEVREMDGLWQSSLLTRMEDQIVRTISSHIHFVPAREAKTAARRDATLDRADIMAQERKQQLVDDQSELALSAAVRRFQDLREGGGHHGAVWKQFLTISARTMDELVSAGSLVEDAADEAGISRLRWMDTQHSAAMATTWPLARGMEPPKRSTASRATKALTASTPKEAIVS